MLHFAKNLKYLREKQGLDQDDMLDLLGIKRSTWSGYESGTSKPKLDDFIMIAEYFGIAETDLLHNASLTDGSDTYQKHPKSKPKSKPNGKPNEENSMVLNDLKAPYGMEELLKSKDETIESLKETIAAQKALLQGYKQRLGEK